MCNRKIVYGCIQCDAEIKTSHNRDGMSCPVCSCGHLIPLRDERSREEIVTRAKYKCLSCEHSDFVRGKRECYQEVRLCPECNGLYVDMWVIHKYAHLKEQDTSGNLLEIKLNDEVSVPQVFYKGEEITKKVKVTFFWETDTEEYGGMRYMIEHVDENVNVPNIKMISHKTKGFCVE